MSTFFSKPGLQAAIGDAKISPSTAILDREEPWKKFDDTLAKFMNIVGAAHTIKKEPGSTHSGQHVPAPIDFSGMNNQEMLLVLSNLSQRMLNFSTNEIESSTKALFGGHKTYRKHDENPEIIPHRGKPEFYTHLANGLIDYYKKNTMADPNDQMNLNTALALTLAGLGQARPSEVIPVVAKAIENGSLNGMVSRPETQSLTTFVAMAGVLYENAHSTPERTALRDAFGQNREMSKVISNELLARMCSPHFEVRPQDVTDVRYNQRKNPLLNIANSVGMTQHQEHFDNDIRSAKSENNLRSAGRGMASLVFGMASSIAIYASSGALSGEYANTLLGGVVVLSAISYSLVSAWSNYWGDKKVGNIRQNGKI